MRFTIGDAVRWGRHSGTVVAVVPAGVSPATYPERRLHEKYQHLSQTYSPRMLGGGGPRREESYLVAVFGRGKPKLYWPRTSALKGER